MNLAPGNNSKATFTPLDGGGSKFEVQYNPKEFRVEKAVTWQEAQNQGKSSNAIQFQNGATMTASFDLIFDTTADGANVQTVWVDQLMALTNATVKPEQGEAAELKKQRPPALTFSWGTFKMKCVIESVNATYLMFSSSGTAVRARCSVKLKQWIVEDFAGSGSSDRFSAAKIKLVDVKGGQTLSQVAAASGSDMRTVAKANGITNPLADLTGQVLSVPSSELERAVTSAVRNAATGAASSAVSAALSGRDPGKAAADAATSAVTGAASQAAKSALKKLF